MSMAPNTRRCQWADIGLDKYIFSCCKEHHTGNLGTANIKPNKLFIFNVVPHQTFMLEINTSSAPTTFTFCFHCFLQHQHSSIANVSLAKAKPLCSLPGKQSLTPIEELTTTVGGSYLNLYSRLQDVITLLDTRKTTI